MDIVQRAKNILLSPNSEWAVIAGEKTGVGDLYHGYILYMAAIPPVCSLIGFSLLFGRLSFGFGLIGALVQYGLALAAVYFVALVAQWLAPKFGGRDDLGQAMKLVAYSHTASWVAGFLLLLPFLAIIGLILALYGLYLLYAGTTPVMGVPPERAVTYTVALIVTVIVVGFVISLVMSLFLGIGMMGMMV